MKNLLGRLENVATPISVGGVGRSKFTNKTAGKAESSEYILSKLLNYLYVHSILSLVQYGQP